MRYRAQWNGQHEILMPLTETVADIKSRNKQTEEKGNVKYHSPVAVLASSASAFPTCSLRTSQTTQRICGRPAEENSRLDGLRSRRGQNSLNSKSSID